MNIMINVYHCICHKFFDVEKNSPKVIVLVTNPEGHSLIFSKPAPGQLSLKKRC